MGEPGVRIDTDVTEREAEVLAAVGEHLTNAQIAARLYISVRTVESHVSSLLRKLGVPDRRALADLGAPSGGAATPPATRPPQLPAPLTSFVGRSGERDALAQALTGHRLVTAVGPGGVGKTRLALAVAAERTHSYADGAWFVDLVPVTDPTMVAAAVAAALGISETHGRSVEDAVITRLTGAQALLILDNCEHLLAGVGVLVERLLSECPRVAVLATSRARLLLPFEFVFTVPGLSIDGDGAGATGDAVTLFVERAVAVGSPAPDADDRRRIAEVCRRLDGVALAVELAAARLPSLGIDGLEEGLNARLRLLTGGHRLHDRHDSLESTLDWSYALLGPADQALLRRLAVFAAPPTVAAAAAVSGFPPLDPKAVGAGLARLADHSLLTPVPGRGTRYRVLETIRQYGEDRLEEAGELTSVRNHHLRWCMTAADRLGVDHAGDLDGWRLAFDQVADDLRAALRWAGDDPENRLDAHQLSLRLAEHTFTRGYPGESQRRYEQAAGLTDDPTQMLDALRFAAAAAETRHVGNEALRLHRTAADLARSLGDDVTAARCLAKAAQLINRAPGLIAELPARGTAEALLAEARALGGEDRSAEAAILTAEAFASDMHGPAALGLADRAVQLAREAGDLTTECAALDQLSAIQLARGDIPAAVDTVRRRVDLITTLRPHPTNAMELADTNQMASEIHLAAGDLAAASRFAAGVASLPFYREEGHLATARQLKVDLLRGDLEAVIARAERFRQGWERAGRPVAGNLAASAYAVATAFGLRAEEEARRRWLEIADHLRLSDRHHENCDSGYAPLLDAWVLLHRGEPEAAVARLSDDPGTFREWYRALWRPWYAAAWAEAAVLADHPDAEARIERARPLVAANPVAVAILRRTAALVRGEVSAMLDAATALERAGSRYQWARTLVLAAGDERARGETELRAMGASPMIG